MNTTTHHLQLAGTILAGILLLFPSSVTAQQSLDDLTIVAVGDSIVVGTGATSGNGFVSVLEDWINLPIINEGVGGDTTQDVLDRLESDVLAHDPDIVILHVGGNDILQGIDQEVTLENLEEIITTIQDTGARVVFLGSHGEIFQFNYEEEYQQLAEETGAFYVPNVLRGILGNPDRLADPIHPNNRGHRLIAERTFPHLQDAINSFEIPEITGSCEAETTEAEVNDQVQWTAYIVGATEPYEYSWSGTDDISGSGRTIQVRYATTGEKTATVTATATQATNTPTFTTQCRNTVNVTAPPLRGSCEVGIRPIVDGARITWTANAAGGLGEFDYEWNGDNLSSNNRSAQVTYTTPGEKVANLTITSGEQERNLTCSAVVPNAYFENGTVTPPTTDHLRGSCNIRARGFTIRRTVRWSAEANGPGTTTPQFVWSGTDGLSGTSSRVSIDYEEPGTKTGTVEISAGGEETELQCQTYLADVEPNGRGCFIATAAFGTPLAQEIYILRDFRDSVLLKSAVGEKLVDLYYRYSPPIAHVIEDIEPLQYLTRTLLEPAIYTTQWISD